MLQQDPKELESALGQFRLIDEAMPVMLAYIDRDLRYRYHNRAFRKWLGREAARINGHTMREVLGDSVFAEIGSRLGEALSGHAVRYQRTQKTTNGGVARLFIHLVPHVDKAGKVVGIYALLINQNRPEGGESASVGTLASAARPAPPAGAKPAPPAGPPKAAQPAAPNPPATPPPQAPKPGPSVAARQLAPEAKPASAAANTGATRVLTSKPAAAAPATAEAPVAVAKPVHQAQSLYDESIDADLTGWQNAADRIKSAIRNDEFHLYAQPIMDLQSESRRFYEIYMRMAEEEENMMPPGAFLPLAEKYGLMVDLDRWAVTAVLKAVIARREANAAWEQATYCINLSRATIADPYFPDFVRAQLAAFNVPGEALRFELQEADVLANPGDAAHLVQHLSQLDCWSVLCGFGRDKVSFDILKDLPVGFLKIDSSIVLKMLRDDSALAKLKSINRVAHTVGINTIAELVESDEMIAKLRQIGIDYAQGMAIGIPMPLKDVP